MDKNFHNQMHPVNYVDVKKVTWSKDSHGLFDYESKNVNCSKYRVETSSRCFRLGHEILFKPLTDSASQMEEEDSNYSFSIIADNERKDKFYLKAPLDHEYDSSKQNVFLIVRSLKNEEGVQRGYSLELGDIIRLGRIEYRVIEYQDSSLRRYSLFDLADTTADSPFKLTIKPCIIDPKVKNQCRICLMDEHDTSEVLVNPCNCKGTSEYVHVNCLQNWINCKVKNKVTPDSACSYWKHLVCEVCKTPFPDLVDVNGSKVQLVPTGRPELPYMLVERIFYNKSKGGDNSRMLVLLSLNNEAHQLKLGRGHECDIRENDISVSRLHAFIKYQDSKFVIIDNNSKFGTLILLRKDMEIEKRKIAVQMGRTVITFSLKHDSTAYFPVNKDPMLVEKRNTKYAPPKNNQDDYDGGLEGFDMNGNLSN